jgi:hypothetical protein
MNGIRKLLLAACMLASTVASADGFFAFEPAGCGSIVTINYTPRWVWITIYDVGQNIHLDYGYVAPFGQRTWKSGRYSCAGIYHVRGEVKNVGGSIQPGDVPNIFDTRVQVSGSTHTVWIKAPVAVRFTDVGYQGWRYDLSRFWWDTNDSAPEPAAFGEVPKIEVVNNSPLGASIGIGNSSIFSCLAPGRTLTFPLDAPGTYNVATGMGCGSRPDISTAVNVVGFSKTTIRFNANFAVQEEIAATAPAITFVNHSIWGVQFEVVGVPRPACLMPNGNVTIPVSPGSHAVHASVVPGCNAHPGNMYPTTPFELTTKAGNNNTNTIFAFHGGLGP